MALNIRPQVREGLRPKLIAYFEGAEVESGSILNPGRAITHLLEAESLLPKSGPVRESLDAFVGEYSLTDFVDDRIRARLTGRQFDPEAKSIPLAKALEGEELCATADKIFDELATLPWDYWASLRLPENLSPLLEALPPVFPAGPFRLVRDASEMVWVAQKPAMGLGGLFGSSLQPAANQYSLQVRVQGFVAKYGETETVHAAHSQLKSFFGLGLALALFKIDGPVPSSNIRQAIIFGHMAGGDIQRVSQKELSHAESETIQRIRLDPGRTEGMDLAMGGNAKLDAMAKLFLEPEQHAPLLRACRWLYDSHVGEDKLLSFVQAMVVLEILLGDKATSDEVGLGTLLANRCAYMIGGSTSQRAAILRDFKAIYSVRSQIVHAGKSRLTSSEEIQLDRLRWLGRTVIREEMKLAIEEMRRRKPAAVAAVPAAIAEPPTAHK